MPGLSLLAAIKNYGPRYGVGEFSDSFGSSGDFTELQGFGIYAGFPLRPMTAHLA